MLKRFFEDKRAVFFTSLLAILALILLASALNNLSFRPVQPLSRPEGESQIIRIPIREAVSALFEIPLWKQIAFFVTLFLLTLLIVSLLSPEMRKRLLRMVVRVAISILLIYYLIKINPDLLKGLFPQFNFGNGTTNPSGAGNIPPPTFEAPHISGALSFLVTLIVLALAAVLIWKFYQWWSDLQGGAAARPLNEIAKIARASLREISANQADSHDVIIQCYANMSQAVDKRRGLQRNYSMTAAEFAQKLENAGLPHEPVDRLTRLFESARYSARTSTPSEVDEAVSCLTLILNFCGENS